MDIAGASPVNLLLRGGTVMVLLQLAFALWRDRRDALAARLCAAFALGTCAFVVNSLPGFAFHPPWWHAPLIALGSGNMLIFWLFTLALVDESFRLHLRHAAVWAALAAFGLANCYWFAQFEPVAAGWASLLLTASTVAFAMLVVAHSLTAWRSDLVEGRRKLRMLIAGSVATYSFTMAVFALFPGHDAREVFSSTGNALGVALLALAIASQLLRAGSDDLFVAAPESESTTTVETEIQTEPAEPDPQLVRTLNRLMVEQRIYREENLTVGTLAEKMGLPEHRLRRLINQGLGYRNFNAFLNSYRIDEISEALRDRTQAGTPILTLALEAGFQSLGPFNRAFKAATGQTPSEYRRTQAIEEL